MDTEAPLPVGVTAAVFSEDPSTWGVAGSLSVPSVPPLGTSVLWFFRVQETQKCRALRSTRSIREILIPMRSGLA